MHLQSLELFGFKSFADKTVFDFHQGVTAIVGPNGCGKSNLLDALRWVLGEQSAKSLRGEEMADVIFNGTDTRKPLGYAEVSLTLTDCARDLGVDWHDLRVTRRLYRDGNSEYFLNKTLCRLRDIQNLFADTGVARSAYSMMEQGKIDMILSSRPEDRRAVFEEAAGITKYKAQKREALRKLEATEANLLRIGDVIKEVKRQIGSLQRQAGKARRYQALLGDLQVLDTHYSRRKLDQLEAELVQCRREIEHLNHDEHQTREKIEEGEQQSSEKRAIIDSLDAKIADARADIEHLQSEMGTNRSRIEFNAQRAEEIRELIGRAQAEIATAEAKREQQKSQIQDVNSSIEQIAKLIQDSGAELARLDELSSDLRKARAQRDAELQSLQISLSRNEARVSALEDEISSIGLRREAAAQRLQQLDQEIAQITDERGQVDHALAAARAATDNEAQTVQTLQLEMRGLEENLAQHRHELTEAERDLIKSEGVLAEKASRLEVLKQLLEEGEGLAQGSQAILKGLDDPARIQATLAGALVSQLEVDPEFVPAIEAALGRNVSAIVLQSADVAAELIASITQNRLGKAALLVPELNGSAPARPKLLPTNATAWAADKVRAPESLQSLVHSLLRDVAIVTNLEEGLRLKRETPQFAAATLKGEFISIEGVVFGGTSDAQKESLLARKARITSLEAEHATITAGRETLERKRDEHRSLVESLSARLEDARDRHRKAELAQSSANNHIAAVERELAEVARRVDSLLSEKTTLRHQIDAADDRVALLQQELTQLRTELSQLAEQRSMAENARLDALRQEERVGADLNNIRLQLATEQQRQENLVTQREPLAARDQELNDLISVRSQEIATYQNRLVSQANDSKAAETGIAEQTAAQEQLRNQLAKLSDQRGDYVAGMQATDDEVRSLRDSLGELHDRRAAAQVRESQLTMKIDNLAENVSRRYHVDLRSFVSDETAFEKTLRVQIKRRDGGSGDPQGQSGSDRQVSDSSEAATVMASRMEGSIHHDLEAIIADLTRRLDDMGPVNLDAVQEYDELEERHKFLEGQNNDLTNARRELLDVIARINSTTKKIFAETFAQVRANFREMFAELFGGGRADLSLLDEADPLNCGIEISAKPPGKQLQTVALLSGGERTMTAVALLFAIYMVRPSPFCVLDELDAPLDESNINRFIRVLERFTSQSQFIIITHNKRTIAKADILYGITMEERGVSKLVGMRLTERPQAEYPAGERGRVTSQGEFAMAENGNGHSEHSVAAR